MKKNVTTALPKQTNWNTYFPWILFFVSFFIYSNGLNNGYNMDDNLVTMNHPITSKGISAFKEIFTTPYYTDEYGNNYGYRPVSQFVFAIEHSLFGENVKISHLINLILYTFGVLLLYQLLILLFENVKPIYLFVACLLFAIHPVHTEVVNSIKNRDELLSLFFALLACNYFILSLKRDKILKLGFSFLFILLAVLSKKSMYPILLIIPGILALTQAISFKKLAISTLIITIPVAIFSSEMQLQRALILGVTPLISLSFIYFFLSQNNRINIERIQRFRWILPTLFIALILYNFYTLQNSIILLCLLPVFFWLFKLNFKAGIGVVSCSLLCIAIIDDYNYLFFLFSMMVSLGFLAYDWKTNTKKQIELVILSLITLIVGTIFSKQTWLFIVVLNYIVFLWLLLYKQKGTLIYSLATFFIVLIVGYFIDKEDLFELSRYAYSFTLIVMSITWKNHIKTTETKWIKQLPIIGITLFFLCTFPQDYMKQLNNSETQLVQVEQPQESKNIPQADILQPETYHAQQKTNKNIFKEGRMLTLIENPLVAPHTKLETIATGLYTLGHYARLLIYPKELSFYYGYSKIDIQNFSSIWVWLSLFFYAGLLFLIVYYLNKNWLISAGFGWYLTCVLLFSNWVELVAGVVGERLVFLASAGFFIGISGLLYEFDFFNLQKHKYLKISFFSIIILLLANRTWTRNYDWKDTYTLMSKDIVHLKNSAQANYLYANSVMRVGMNNKALTPEQRMIFFHAGVNHFKQAVAVDSTFFRAQYDLARAYMYVRDTANAINTFEICNRLSPHNTDVSTKLNFLKERFISTPDNILPK